MAFEFLSKLAAANPEELARQAKQAEVARRMRQAAFGGTYGATAPIWLDADDQDVSAGFFEDPKYANGQTYGGQHAYFDTETGQMVSRGSDKIEKDRQLARAAAADQRGAYQVDNTQANEMRGAFQGAMGQGGMSRDMQLGAYGQQQDVANRYAAMASGEGPSLAQAMLNSGMDRTANQQLGLAASARGPAALAMAQQNATANTALAQQQTGASMAQLRAQEQLNAMQGYGQSTQALQNSAGAIRGQDYSAAGLYNQAGAQDAQRAQYQAQIEMQQRAMNDVRAAQSEAAYANVNNQQLQANLQSRALDNGATQINLGQKMADQARADAMLTAGIGAAGAVAGTLLAGPIGGAAGATAATAATKAATAPSPAPAPTPATPTTNPNAYANARAPESPNYRDPNSPVDSDLRNKRNITNLEADELDRKANSLAAAQAAMYGQPGAPDPYAEKAAGLVAAQRAMYGAESPVAQTLRGLTPISFNYRPGMGYDPKREYVGVGAQQLKATPAGKALVDEGKRGQTIDARGAIGFNLAAAAHLQKQMDELKAKQDAMYAAPVAVRGGA